MKNIFMLVGFLGLVLATTTVGIGDMELELNKSLVSNYEVYIRSCVSIAMMFMGTLSNCIYKQ